ncbi:TPA: DUF1372 family protein [Streptococcus suis]|uniref:DUF1372 family protein n=1 Tax=Streptococcus suis TaxID=1307 RepID=UPI000942CA10|nr:DUF1372 family protein [Streptococcus suis]MDY7303998.1 DUF1372 family protein [Streptococcus suis]HEL1665510.1 DUF1372 family protein [Streptococcus suis]HEL1687493.1 DUF1372 family protein [Streptococcus suis]HEL2249179.1 DUF1372 family protein [Streptococcus suis]HEL2674028.1 DUF1372 family protein [Streptococcus suis]
MERFEKVLIPILVGLVISLGFNLRQAKQKIAELESREPIIIYQVDNAGTDMFGKVTAKNVIDGRYYVEIKPYGKFLVTKEQYEEIEIGQDMPEWLKGQGN